MQGYYRSGSAAKILGISRYHLRRLCETGLVRGERLPSGQWRVPVSEIERFQREPIPRIPQGLLDEEKDLSEEENWDPEDEDPVGSERSTGTSARVAESAHQIAIARNQLEKRKIDLQRRELEDRVRARERQATEQRAARVSAARQQRDQQWEAEREKRWRDDWHDYAFQSLPADASPEVRLSLPDLVDEALSKSDVRQAQHITQSLVDAALDRVLEPHRRQKQIDRLIEQAVGRLPSEAKDTFHPTQWQLRATAAARRALRGLPEAASPEEIEIAAREAVEPVRREFTHNRMCEAIVSALAIPGATPEELKEAKAKLKLGLDALPVGSSEEQFKVLIAEVLSPLCQRIDLRQDQALRGDVVRGISCPAGFPVPQRAQVVGAVEEALARLPQGTPRNRLEQVRDQVLEPFLRAHGIQQRKAALLSHGLAHISFALSLLVIARELKEDTRTISDKLTPDIRKHLERQLTGNESPESVRELVRNLIRRELGLEH